MSQSVINDTPGQGFLWNSYRKNRERNKSTEWESGDWIDKITEPEHIGSAEVFSCNPETCTDDCEKCRIFGK